MSEFYQQLKKAMGIRNITQAELCEKTKIPKSAMSQYISGSFKPKQLRTYQLAVALDVNEAWLMGYDDVPMERTSNYSDNDNIFTTVSNLYPVKTKMFPILGEIACGKPIFANENHESYISASETIKADFCLKAKGDSMINARIYDGDIVFIRKQDMVENGEIAAVIIGDEATLIGMTNNVSQEDFVTLMYLAGVDVLTAKEQAGHADVKTTLSIYTHLDSKFKQRDIDKLDNYIDGGNMGVAKKQKG